MTTPVRIQQSIRQLETKGLTHTQIAREPGVSRTTVVKYATRDYSPVPPTGGTASRSLVAGEYARKADEWLEADRRMPRKQRHTARRVHERLVEECGFEGSYSSARRWVKRWRQRRRGEAEAFARRYHTAFGVGFILVGIYVLYDNLLMPLLATLLNSISYDLSWLWRLAGNLPTLVVALIIILLGIRLIRGDAKRDQDDVVEFRGEE